MKVTVCGTDELIGGSVGRMVGDERVSKSAKPTVTLMDFTLTRYVSTGILYIVFID